MVERDQKQVQTQATRQDRVEADCPRFRQHRDSARDGAVTVHLIHLIMEGRQSAGSMQRCTRSRGYIDFVESICPMSLGGEPDCISNEARPSGTA
jgi:hypothetical protein